METATRWKQGLESFCAGLTLLQQGRKPGPTVLNRLEVEGVIHRFEYTLDLAWKVARDFLEESGLRIAPRTPREVLRQAAAAQIVDDGQVWIDMLNHRTLLAHNYGGVVFNEVAEAL
ncbi:MAG TPA: HI0074 family nucleotidyltransferase substrate-binding subunit, partial [Chthoniobacterales bacterium]